jgi:hypothetical protein
MMNATILVKYWLLQASFLPLQQQSLHGPAYGTFFKKYSVDPSQTGYFSRVTHPFHLALTRYQAE